MQQWCKPICNFTAKNNADYNVDYKKNTKKLIYNRRPILLNLSPVSLCAKSIPGRVRDYWGRGWQVTPTEKAVLTQRGTRNSDAPS